MNTDRLPGSTDGQRETSPIQPHRVAPVPASATSLAPINILIVDDEPKNLTVLETVLDDPGYRVVRAESADQALLALVVEEFALLILDIRMPGMTGFELAQTIKDRKKTARVPIIFLTAYYNEDQHVLEGYNTGAVDYLHKPVNAAILRSKVAVFAELHRKQRESEVANSALLSEVTERRRAQEQLRELNETLEQRVIERTEALREKEHFLRRITEVTPGVIQVFHLETQTSVFATRAVASLAGYNTEEIQAMGGEVISTLMHPDDFPRFAEHMERLRTLRDDEFADFEHRMRAKSGEYVWLQNRDAVFARDAKGAVQQILGATFEITERKLAEEAVRESEERFRAIADGIPQLAWMADSHGRLDWFNKGWLEYTGTTLEDNLGVGWKAVLHPDYIEAVAQRFECALRAGKDWEDTFPLRDKEGRYRWFLSRMNALRDQSGKVRRFFGTNTDVTERFEMEKTIRQQSEQLAEESRRKDEFLATLAHELRNPLAPMRMAVQLLQAKGSPNPELQWARGVIDRQTQNLARLIDDLMDASRISRGKLELKRERVELAEVVQGAVETSRPLIEECGHELTVTLPPDSLVVDADLIRLAQVFLNLLNNAAKYTERGGRIDLGAERLGSDVVVTVKDSGIGIATAKLPIIFDMFSQVEGALSRSRGGLGIGLCLAKQLVEMHGGHIEARSEGPGKGSEFVVRLPIVVERTDAGKTIDEVDKALPTSDLRILVVDDNPDSASMMALVLKRMGNNVRTAHDGEEAVRMAGEFLPQVVLCDIGLPKMNGYEAARIIRQEPWGKKMILIAVTGWGQDDDKRRSEEVGFDRHLVKPVDPQSLMKMLAALDVMKR